MVVVVLLAAVAMTVPLLLGQKKNENNETRFTASMVRAGEPLVVDWRGSRTKETPLEAWDESK